MSKRCFKITKLPILIITIIVFVSIIYYFIFTILSSDVKKVDDKYGYTYYVDRQGNKVVDKEVRYNGQYILLDKYGYPARDTFIGEGEHYYDKYGFKVVDKKVNIGDNIAYFDHIGNIVKNKWIHIDGQNYYAGKDGFFLKDTWIDETYYVDRDGHQLKDTVTPDGSIVDKNGKFVYVNDYNIDFKNVNVGDVIKFGKIYGEDFEWIVVDKYVGKILLMSKYVIDNKPYHNSPDGTTWKDSYLRKYLNDEFYFKIFSRKDREVITPYLSDNFGNNIYNTIIDKNTNDLVSIPSKEEIRKYFGIGAVSSGVNAKVVADVLPNLKSNTLNVVDGYAAFWLRNNGLNPTFALNVECNGAIENVGDPINSDEIGVRPCIWVDFER